MIHQMFHISYIQSANAFEEGSGEILYV